MSTLKLRAAAASALFCLALAGPATSAHAMKNDGRYAKTVGSRVLAGSLTNSSYCGDTLDQYNYFNNQANGFIAQWQFGKANQALDEAAKWRSDAASQGCAWPSAV